MRRVWRFLQLSLFIAAWMFLSPLLPDRWLSWCRLAGDVSLLPLLAMLVVGILGCIFRETRLSIDGILATVAVFVGMCAAPSRD